MKGGKIMKKILFVAMALISMTACSNPDRDYDTASKTDTIENYRSFLEKYPADHRKAAVLMRIEELSWAKARTAKTIPAIDGYLGSYPKGTFVEEAQSLRRRIELNFLPVFEGTITVTMLSPAHNAERGVVQLTPVLILESGGKEYQLITGKNTLYKGLEVSPEGVRWHLGKKYSVRGNLLEKVPAGVVRVGKQFVDARLIQFLIDAKAVGTTPLIAASFNGQNEEVKRLIATKANFDTKDKIGWTALMVASDMGQQEVVQTLINAGADVNARNAYGATALMRASREGSIEVVRILIGAKADVNVRMDDGTTALKLASKAGHKKIAEILKKAGALE
jgi:hypothetical protein